MFDEQSIEHVSITDYQEIDRDTLKRWRKFLRLKRWWQRLFKDFDFIEVGDQVVFSNGKIATAIALFVHTVVCEFDDGTRFQYSPVTFNFTPETLVKKQHKRVIEACFGHTELYKMAWPVYDKIGALVWCDWIQDGEWGPVWQAKAEMLRVIIEEGFEGTERTNFKGIR